MLERFRLFGLSSPCWWWSPEWFPEPQCGQRGGRGRFEAASIGGLLVRLQWGTAALQPTLDLSVGQHGCRPHATPALLRDQAEGPGPKIWSRLPCQCSSPTVGSARSRSRHRSTS